MAARESTGAWRMFDLACLWCGARLIQRLGKLRVTNAEITQRRRAVLADWVGYGHKETEIRDLVPGPMALAPIVKEQGNAPRRSS